MARARRRLMLEAIYRGSKWYGHRVPGQIVDLEVIGCPGTSSRIVMRYFRFQDWLAG